MKKKVAIIKSQVFRVGGLEKYCFELAAAFARRDFEVCIISSGDLQACEQKDLEIISLRKLYGPSVLRIQQFKTACDKYLEKHSFDIVFGLDRSTKQSHYRAGNGVHAAYLNYKKNSLSFFKQCFQSINPLHRLILKIEKETFENPSLRCLFCNSDMVKNELLHYYQIDPQKIFRIHNGVEWEKWKVPFEKWPEEKKRLATDFGLDPKQHQFLFLGNDFQRKGLSFSLQALAKFKNENWQLSVVGKDKRMAGFQKLCRQLKIEKRVKFFGCLRQPLAFYQIADTLLIPSIYDPFANVTVEALAMGLFVISSQQNGGSEVLDKENGYIIEDLFSEQKLYNAIESALKHKKTQESATKIRQRAKPFDFSVKIEEMLDKSLEFV